MNDEKKKIDTEIPIKVSEKERQIVLQALEEANRSEGLVSHEDALAYIDKIKERVRNRKNQRALLKVGSYY